MLTGGRSAERVYTAWSESRQFSKLERVRFYFGDERCVQPDDPESNFRMVMDTLFQRGVPACCALFRMEAEDPEGDAAAFRYAEILPAEMDVMLLGIGEDGHVASLFPGSEALRESSRRVIPVVGPKSPYKRLTITPPVIAQAKSIFVLAPGVQKAAVLMRLLHKVDEVSATPARLALNATWLLDAPLLGGFS